MNKKIDWFTVPMRANLAWGIRHRLAEASLLLLAAAWLSGCSVIPVSEQGLTAKPNMQFADTAVFRYQSKL